MPRLEARGRRRARWRPSQGIRSGRRRARCRLRSQRPRRLMERHERADMSHREHRDRDTGTDTATTTPGSGTHPTEPSSSLGVVLTLIALAGAFLGVANASQAETLSAQLTQRYLVLLPGEGDPGSGVGLPGARHRGLRQCGSCRPPRMWPEPKPTQTPSTSPSRPCSASSRCRATPNWRLFWPAGCRPISPRSRLSVHSWPAGRTRHRPRNWLRRRRRPQAKPRCNLGLPAGDHHRASDHDGRAGACGRQPSPGRSLVVHRHRRGSSQAP